MIAEPSKLVAARAALEKAAANLSDPTGLGELQKVVGMLARELSGIAPPAEKEIAKKLLLACRNKALLETKVILANFASYESDFLDYWQQVVELFVHPELAEDAQFNACKAQLTAWCALDQNNSLPAVRAAMPKKPRHSSRPDDRDAKIIEEVRSMPHANTLRVIGQSLETIRLQEFNLEKNGDYFFVQSDALTTTHQWILRDDLGRPFSHPPVQDRRNTQLVPGDGWLFFGPLDIARLDGRERKNRNVQASGQKPSTNKLGELLRILGEQLDSRGATAFTISWTGSAVSVDFETPDQSHERKDFTVEKLQQLASYSRFRRWNDSPPMRFR
jgi:hypothetical protein